MRKDPMLYKVEARLLPDEPCVFFSFFRKWLQVRCNSAMEWLFYSEQEVQAMGSQLHATTPAILTR